MQTIRGNYRRGGTAILLAQYTARDGTGATVADGKKLVKVADVSSVTVALYNLSSSTPTATVYTATPATATVLFDTLKEWDIDTVGANLMVTIPASAFTVAEAEYKAKVTITGTSGNVGIVDFIGPAVD